MAFKRMGMYQQGNIQPSHYPTIQSGHPLARGLFIAGATPYVGEGKFSQRKATTASGKTRPLGGKARHGVYGVKFNGTTDVIEYLLTPPVAPYTIIVGVVFNTVVAANHTIISLGKPVDINGFAIKFGSNFGNTHLVVDSPNEAYDTGFTPVVGTRYMVAATLDSSKNSVFYVDGNQKATHTFLAAMPNPTTSIGFGAQNAAAGYTFFSDATIDFFGVWSRVLPVKDISEISANPWQIFSPNLGSRGRLYGYGFLPFSPRQRYYTNLVR